MRVLQVDSGREWRGGQNQVRLLCRELAGRADVENRLFTKRGSELARRARADLIPIIPTSWGMGVSPSAFVGLADAARTFAPDLVHVHDSHSLTLALWARRTLSLQLIGRARDPFRIVAHRRVDFRVGPRSTWRRADRIIAVSEGVKRILVKDGLPEGSIAVIPDGIDAGEVRAAAGAVPLIRKRLGLPAGVPLALNAAALVDHKDQATLIRAAAAARSRAPTLHWAIAGEGPLQDALKAEIAALRVGDIVHLVGYVEPIDALIKEASVFVMSSKEEGLGSVVLHAFALGTPVVSTAAGGLPEMVPPEWLAPVGDAPALAERVLQALAHPAPVPLAERFTAKSMTEAVLAQYRLLL